MRRHGVDVLLLVVPRPHRHQKIEIADGLLAAPQGTGRRHRLDGRARLGDVGDEPLGFFVRHIDVESPGAGEVLELLSGLQDVLFALFAEAGNVAQFSFASQLFEALDAGDLELLPK